jgi:hypothetical protein
LVQQASDKSASDLKPLQMSISDFRNFGFEVSWFSEYIGVVHTSVFAKLVLLGASSKRQHLGALNFISLRVISQRHSGISFHISLGRMS